MKISKNILLVLLCLSVSSGLIAQAFGPKTSVVTIGAGFPNLYKSILKSNISANNSGGYYGGSGVSSYAYDVKGLGPFFVKYEYGLNKVIGVGASIGYWNTVLTETDKYQDQVYDSNTGNYVYTNYQDVTKYNFSSLSVGARLNFHFATQEKLDPYAGLAAGYTAANYSTTYSTNNPNQSTHRLTYNYSGIPVYFAITAGLRYYFTDNIGAYVELGIDKWSVIQGGLAIKF